MSTLQNILVVGATGFTGRRVMAELFREMNEGRQLGLTCFVRPGTTPPVGPDGRPLNVVRGDLNNRESLEKALQGKDGLVYVASLGFGHGPAVVAALANAGVRRAVFVSTTAIFTRLNAQSKGVRQQAEGAIERAGKEGTLQYTLIRPTMIYGRKGDRNMERLVRFMHKYPGGTVYLPVPGGGQAKMQPVFVDDVARAVVKSFFSDRTIGKSYNISGATVLSFAEVAEKAARLAGKKLTLIPIPLAPCVAVLKGYEMLVPRPRLKGEQLLRLNEDKAFPHDMATRDFGFQPIGFDEGLKKLAGELLQNG